jgi:transposase, IS605 orfB family
MIKKVKKRIYKNRSDIITLTERHVIRENHVFFDECDRLSLKAKNLYNATLYVQRQSFFNPDVKFINYYDVNKEFTDNNQFDYRALPAKVSKQVQMLVDKSFKSYFTLLKKKNKGEYDKPVKIPRYLDKTKGRFVVPYPKDAISLKTDGFVKLSKTDISIPTRIDKDLIVGVRIVPKGNHYIIEVLYDVVKPNIEVDYSRVAFIDPGLNNLMTVTSNVFNPILYNGRPVKSINQIANKNVSKRQGLRSLWKLNAKTKNKDRVQQVIFPRLESDNSKLTRSIWSKRSNRINDYFHKVTTNLMNHLVLHDIKTVVMGYNIGQKQDIDLGKVTNQNFVNIPFTKLISMLEYKCQLAGINFVVNEESYTSLCSFVDKEDICKHKEYCGNRVERGLFETSSGLLINADVNGSLNIGRKYLESIGEYSNELHNQLLNYMVNPKRLTISI